MFGIPKDGATEQRGSSLCSTSVLSKSNTSPRRCAASKRFGLQDFLALDVILAGLLNGKFLGASIASIHREKSLFDSLLNHYLK